MVWGGRREEGSGWGTCVYLWRIHVDIWQNQYNIVKLKKKFSLSWIPTHLRHLLSTFSKIEKCATYQRICARSFLFFHSNSPVKILYNVYFIYDKLKAGDVTCPRLHSYLVMKLGFTNESSSPRSNHKGLTIYQQIQVIFRCHSFFQILDRK